VITLQRAPLALVILLRAIAQPTSRRAQQGLARAMAGMVARLVGEGHARPGGEAELPLDISHAGVTDWLAGRKLLPRDWNRRLQAAQARAAAAAAALPPGFFAAADGAAGADAVDYARAKAALERLAASAERGMLGSYKGAAGEWQKVVAAYESGLLHVAEAGQALARNVDYELPALKRAAARAQRAIADLERRRAEALRAAAAAAAEHRRACAALGLGAGAAGAGPAGLRAALDALAAEQLPGALAGAVDAVRAAPVREAAAQYAAFVRMLALGGGGDGSSAAALLPTLGEVHEGRVEAGAAAAVAAAAAAPAIEIDWGGGGAGAVDWGGGGGGEDAASAAPGASAGMSWDIEVEAGEEAEGGAEAAAAEPAAAAGGDDAGAWEIDVAGGEGAAGGGGAAAGAAAAALAAAPPEVARLGADADFRARLLDDLEELRAFAAQRAAELGARGAEALPAGAPEEVAALAAPRAGELAAAVAAAAAALTGERLTRLVGLAGGGAAAERTLAALARGCAQEARHAAAARDAEARRAEAQRGLVADAARRAALVDQTRAAKALVEAALGAKLKRPVNIQGVAAAL
jgi:hypothetical protein